ncbi:MAG: arylformamidase [Verrucomicrobiales bacterium]
MVCRAQSVCVLVVWPPSDADVFNIEEVTTIHTILLTGNVVIVEGLTHLDQLSERKVTFIALPLKIEAGDGAPCRAMAIENGALYHNAPSPQ